MEGSSFTFKSKLKVNIVDLQEFTTPSSDLVADSRYNVINLGGRACRAGMSARWRPDCMEMEPRNPLTTPRLPVQIWKYQLHIVHTNLIIGWTDINSVDEDGDFYLSALSKLVSNLSRVILSRGCLQGWF